MRIGLLACLPTSLHTCIHCLLACMHACLLACLLVCLHLFTMALVHMNVLGGGCAADGTAQREPWHCAGCGADRGSRIRGDGGLGGDYASHQRTREKCSFTTGLDPQGVHAAPSGIPIHSRSRQAVACMQLASPPSCMLYASCKARPRPA